jgi:hypothetical protein
MMGTKVEAHRYGCPHVMRQILSNPEIEDICRCEELREHPIEDRFGNRFIGTITWEDKYEDHKD